MRIFIATILFAIFSVFSEQIIAQNTASNEIVVIKGKKYIAHQVMAGETVYAISKKYNIDQNVLLELNPTIKNGLKTGEILKIPFIEGPDKSGMSVYQKGDPDGFYKHKIKSKKETTYSIAKEYNITIEELRAYNPHVSKFKKGVVLNIPYWNAKEEPIVEESAPTETKNEIIHQVISGETLFSISRKYNMPVSEILAQNPEAQNLKAGMKLHLKAGQAGTTKIQSENLPEAEHREIPVNYLEHIIESGETMWGTTRKYNVTEEELKELNPILNTGFPAGVVIKIPIHEIEKTVAKPVNENAFKKHLVEKGETLFGLSKQYEISIPDIKKYNPVLENRNLVYGETILIPEKPDEIFEQIVSNNKADSARLVEEYYKVELPVEIPQGCLSSTDLDTFKTYHIALFLPLFLEANDTLNREDAVIDTMALYTEEEVEVAQDTTIELEERKELFKQFYGGTENFVQFYEGVLLAIDSLQMSGLKVQVEVFDTQRNIDSVRHAIFSPGFLSTDLIIGPIYPAVQNDVVQIAGKNRIPIVSPLASQSKFTAQSPVYYQVNPSREYITMRTAEMVAEEYYKSNFIVVKTQNYQGTPEGELVELFQEKFYNSGFMSNQQGVNFTIYDFENEGASGLRRIMSKTKENVVYIPSSDEGKVSVAVSNVNNLTDDYSITLIGSSRYPNYSSIDIDHYHNLKLKYISPYWVDYTQPYTMRFVERFKDNFGTEPNNFGMQGYDVTLYFMQALATFGNSFDNCLPYMHSSQVQGNYHFEKLTQFGGYMNQGVSVIQFTRDYRVIQKRVKGQPRLVAEK